MHPDKLDIEYCEYESDQTEQSTQTNIELTDACPIPRDTIQSDADSRINDVCRPIPPKDIIRSDVNCEIDPSKPVPFKPHFRSDSSTAIDACGVPPKHIIKSDLRSSANSFKDSCRPLKDINSSNLGFEVGSVTILELCRILQNPDCPKFLTIIKENVREEIINHSSNPLENINTANKYQYYRDIIKQYLKSDSLEPRQDILKRALVAAGADFSNIHLCLEVTTGQTDSNIKATSIGSIFSKVDAKTSYSNMDKQDSKYCNPTCKPEDDPEDCTPCPKQEYDIKTQPPCGPDKHRPPKCPKEKKCKEKIKKVCGPESSSSKCDEQPDIVVVTGPDCLENIQTEKLNSNNISSTTINLKNFEHENSQIYETEPSQNGSDDLSSPVESKSIQNVETEELRESKLKDVKVDSEESFSDSRSITMTTIKGAVEDFIEKVYKTTQDTVSLMGNPQEAKQSEWDKEAQRTYKAEMIGSILSTVDAALGAISATVSSQCLEKFREHANFNNTSATYDKPIPTTDVMPHNFAPESIPAANSVFSTIKDKIYSMFREGESKVEEKITSNFSLSSVEDEDNNDENLDHE